MHTILKFVFCLEYIQQVKLINCKTIIIKYKKQINQKLNIFLFLEPLLKHIF